MKKKYTNIQFKLNILINAIIYKKRCQFIMIKKNWYNLQACGQTTLVNY